ncbi:hypothetical protein RHORCCE3_1953 [Rickettsia hoogstraalii str. RCCE3]|nr:hypothetical protein RHORCCE3_1953 [Rickettsia hoogstraalii str. RCCE3]
MPVPRYKEGNQLNASLLVKRGKPIIWQLIVGKRGLKKLMTLSRKTTGIHNWVYRHYVLIRNDADLRLVIT